MNVDREHRLSDAELDAVLNLASSAGATPWESWVEGRDGLSGATFIMTGTAPNRGELYLYGFGGKAESDLVDLFAEMRNSIDELVAETVARRSGNPPRVSPCRFDRLQQLSAACPAPPWKVMRTGIDIFSGVEIDPEKTVIDSGTLRFGITSGDGPVPEMLLNFIVETRNVVPGLLDELRAA